MYDMNYLTQSEKPINNNHTFKSETDENLLFFVKFEK